MADILSIDEMNGLLARPPSAAPDVLSIEQMNQRFNQPTGEARSVSQQEAQRGSLAPVDDPARAASMATIARASLAPDPNDQINRFAAARFPGIPVGQAAKYYGIINGDIVYADPTDGKIYKEVSTIGGTPNVSEVPARIAQQVASGVGPSIPAVAAGVAGAMVGPTGMSIPAAGLAAGGADAARQALDRYFAGEDPTNISLGNVAGQAAMNAAGQAAGVGLAKVLQRNPLGVRAYDAVKARDPAEQAAWTQLYAEAQRRGIDLSVGEATGLRSLRAQERLLRRQPETTDRMNDFVANRNTEQVPAAMRAELDRIAPPRNVGEGAAMLRQGADDTLKFMADQRSQAASPHYQRAFASGVEPDVTPVLADINDRLARVGTATPTGRGLMAMRDALTEVKNVVDPATGETVAQRVPISNYEKLHSIKESFDDIVSGAFDAQQTSAAKRAARDMAGTKSELMGVLKTAHPGYQQGAEIYARMSVPIQDARKGALNALLDKEGAAPIRYAEALFDAAKDIPPMEITKIRQLYNAAGKQEEWNAGVRAFMADKLDTAMRVNASGEPGNVPGMVQKTLWGTGNQRDILRAAIGDQQLATSFEKLMGVLNAAAKSLPEGSPTATDLLAADAASRPGAAAKTVGKVLSPAAWLNLGDDVVEGITSLRRPAQRIALAEHLLTPSGMEKMRQMTLLSPTSLKARALTAQLLTDAGIVGTARWLGMGVPDDRMPDPPL